MSRHTLVYDPFIYADGVHEPYVVARYCCQECDCSWPCEAVENLTTRTTT